MRYVNNKEVVMSKKYCLFVEDNGSYVVEFEHPSLYKNDTPARVFDLCVELVDFLGEMEYIGALDNYAILSE